MSSLKPVEKQRLEDLFGMASGCVLNFKDSSFAAFFRQTVGVNINDQCYAFNGSSKAKKMRAFWEIENDAVVGKVVEGMLEIWRYLNESEKNERTNKTYTECCKTAERLLGRTLEEETAENFLKRDLGVISISGLDLDSGIEAILSVRIKEATACASAGASLATIFMCGSILEGLLLSFALKNPMAFNQANSCPKIKDTGNQNRSKIGVWPASSMWLMKLGSSDLM